MFDVVWLLFSLLFYLIYHRSIVGVVVVSSFIVVVVIIDLINSIWFFLFGFTLIRKFYLFATENLCNPKWRHPTTTTMMMIIFDNYLFLVDYMMICRNNKKQKTKTSINQNRWHLFHSMIDDFINQNQRSTIYMFQSKKQNTTKQNKTQSVDDDQSRNHFIPLLSINIIIFLFF